MGQYRSPFAWLYEFVWSGRLVVWWHGGRGDRSDLCRDSKEHNTFKAQPHLPPVLSTSSICSPKWKVGRVVGVQDQITLLAFLILNVCGSSYCEGSFYQTGVLTLFGLEGTRGSSSSVLGSGPRKMEGRLLASAEEEIPEFHKASCECVLCKRISHFQRVRFDYNPLLHEDE